ncbi:MAG: hypothetical protein VB118_06470 [Oscillospiraceae bacterium]|nr:hypothetical protein [Oscillospiraceae bacterium]
MINNKKAKDAIEKSFNDRIRTTVVIFIFILCCNQILMSGCSDAYDRTPQISVKFSSPCEYTAGFVINEMHGVMNIKFDGTDVMKITIQGESDLCGLIKTIREDTITTEFLGCEFETDAKGDIFSDLRALFIFLGTAKYQSSESENTTIVDGKSVRTYNFEPPPSGTEINLSVDVEGGTPVKLKYSATNGKDKIELNFS